MKIATNIAIVFFIESLTPSVSSQATSLRGSHPESIRVISVKTASSL